MSQTFPQYVISTYGKSVHQIRLEVAAAYFIAHGTPDGAWRASAEFLTAMETALSGEFKAHLQHEGEMQRLRNEHPGAQLVKDNLGNVKGVLRPCQSSP
jgi:hypothetical protein